MSAKGQKSKTAAFRLFFISAVANVLSPLVWHMRTSDHPSRTFGLAVSSMMILSLITGFFGAIVSLIGARIRLLLGMSALFVLNILAIKFLHTQGPNPAIRVIHWGYVALSFFGSVWYFMQEQGSEDTTAYDPTAVAAQEALTLGLPAYTTIGCRLRIILHLVIGGGLVLFLSLLGLSLLANPGWMIKGIAVLELAITTLCFFAFVWPVTGILGWAEPEFILTERGLWVARTLIPWQDVGEANTISTRTLRGSQGMESETQLFYFDWSSSAPANLRDKIKELVKRRIKGHTSTMGQGIPKLGNCIVAVPLKGISLSVAQLDEYLKRHNVRLNHRAPTVIREIYERLKEDEPESELTHRGGYPRNKEKPSSALLSVQAWIESLGVFSRGKSQSMEKVADRWLGRAAYFFVSCFVITIVSTAFHLDKKFGFDAWRLPTVAVWVLLLAFFGINGFGLFYKLIDQLRGTKRQPSTQGWIFFGMFLVLALTFIYWFIQLSIKLLRHHH